MTDLSILTDYDTFKDYINDICNGNIKDYNVRYLQKTLDSLFSKSVVDTKQYDELSSYLDYI